MKLSTKWHIIPLITLILGFIVRPVFFPTQAEEIQDMTARIGQTQDAGTWELANGYTLKAFSTQRKGQEELELIIFKDVEGQDPMPVAIEITETGRYTKTDTGEGAYHLMYSFVIERTLGKADYCDIYVPKNENADLIFSCG